jgi:EAL domain-containing protein (putative c-di-GMP-specific phosphodiesterase class I)
LSLENSLRHALARNELTLQYQAKRDLTTGGITGAEALLRWRHPELGMLLPPQFLTIAEESGLIVPIGRWVLKTACAQNVAWQRAGLPPVCVAVNISMRQFAEPDLLQDITDALRESGMPPSLLELELTERTVMQNVDRTVEVFTALKDMGVRLAIDNFGASYASLAQIKRFPIDALKIDRSCISDLQQDAENAAITKAIVALGKTLSLTVVAEGVETSEQERFLRDHACDEMQGYFFSKPVTGDQFAALLRERVDAATLVAG